jgi:acyl-CoA dehydrogenase
MTTDTARTLESEVRTLAESAKSPGLVAAAELACDTVRRAYAALETVSRGERDETEAAARGIALTLARSLELSLLARHAQWSLDQEQDGRAELAAQVFAQQGVDRLLPRESLAKIAALADDRPLFDGER